MSVRAAVGQRKWSGGALGPPLGQGVRSRTAHPRLAQRCVSYVTSVAVASFASRFGNVPHVLSLGCTHWRYCHLA